MRKLLLTLGFLALSLPTWAASALSTVTVSQTLTMTSPSAIISATGVSATEYITNIVARNVSTAFISTTTISATLISSTSPNIAAASVNFAGISSVSIRKTFNISSVTRVVQGAYGISFTVPMSDANYSVAGNCERTATNESWFEVTDQTTSPTTTGFTVRCQATAGATDSDRVNVVVFP